MAEVEDIFCVRIVIKSQLNAELAITFPVGQRICVAKAASPFSVRCHMTTWFHSSARKLTEEEWFVVIQTEVVFVDSNRRN